MNPYVKDMNLTVGPLTLDGNTLRAVTVFHTETFFSKEEFSALYMLAACEDQALSFDWLYEKVWDKNDGMDRRDEARGSLEHVMEQINDIERNFLWIEYRQGKGYALRTRWAHNKEKWLPKKAGMYADSYRVAFMEARAGPGS